MTGMGIVVVLSVLVLISALSLFLGADTRRLELVRER
jgi:hypothetical protein